MKTLISSILILCVLSMTACKNVNWQDAASAAANAALPILLPQTDPKSPRKVTP